jgi:hypothetical protein
MIPPQTPTLQIFIRAQTMLFADMPTQHFRSKAAIKANHIVVAYRLPYRDNRSGNFLGLIWPSKLRKRSMHRRDQFRNLIGLDCMMPHVAPDDLCRQVWIDDFVVHGITFVDLLLLLSYTEIKLVNKR